MQKKKILLKITGELFLDKDKQTLTPKHVENLIGQIKVLQDEYQFGIVVGGGNFFRGNQHGSTMGTSAPVGHQIGMLATIMNGLILKDLLEKHAVGAELFCAMPSPAIGKPTSQQLIDAALSEGKTVIFTGGTGNPFFTTDTTAVLRSLQINADEVWKGTTVDGVYSADPYKNPQAKRIAKLRLSTAMSERLGVMDITAYAMAEQHHKRIRIFDIFTPDALLHAAKDATFGSIIE